VSDGTLGCPPGGVSSSNRGRPAVEAALAQAAGAWAAGAGAVTMAVRLLYELVCSIISLTPCTLQKDANHTCACA